MRVLRRLTTPQRVVLVVALGLLLLSGGAWWYLGEVTAPPGGWFAYEPSHQQTDTYWYVTTGRRAEFLVVPVALVLFWTATSLWLLGLRPDSPDRDH